MGASHLGQIRYALVYTLRASVTGSKGYDVGDGGSEYKIWHE